MRRFVVGLLILVSALTLVFSSTSLWTRRHVVNTDVFVAGTHRILTDPAVQGTIEAQLVNAIMTNPDVQGAVDQGVALLPPRLQAFRPTIQTGVQNLLSRGVHEILTSPAFNTLTTAVLRNAQTQLINGESVTLTVGQAKALIPPQDRTGLAGQVLNLIPDNTGVTVLTKAQAPQVYSALDLLKTLWLWLGLISLAALTGALVVSRRRLKTLRAWSVTTGVVGLLLVLALKVARGPLLAQVKPANVNAADAIYDGIMGSLRSWTLWLVLIMTGILVITLLWGRIGIIPAIRRGYNSARAHAAQHREQRAAEQRARAAAVEAGGDPAEVPAVPKDPWPRRAVAATTEFADGLNLPERLGALAGFIRRNLRVVRWTGIAVGALVLLFWPAPTLSVLIWVAAFVALYLGLLELVLAIAARAEGAPTGTQTTETVAAGAEPAGDGSGTTAPATARAGESQPTAPLRAKSRVPAARQGGSSEAPPRRPHVVSSEDLAAMGGRLDLLMRLADARNAGVLTDDEFAKEKTELLNL